MEFLLLYIAAIIVLSGFGGTFGMGLALSLLVIGCMAFIIGFLEPRFKHWKRERALQKSFAVKINNSTFDEEEELGI